MQPSKITILGVGLLGGSIGLACRSALTGCKISGYGHRPATLYRAKEIGAVDQIYDDPAQAVAGADLVILATPVGLFDSLLRKIAPALSPGTVVTDVGSTKRSVVRLAEQVIPPTAHFVGSHPMAGGERRGVEFARADLFTHAVCLVTPTAKTDPAALAAVEDFWKLLGMRLIRLDPAEHDRLLAQISHLPHAVAGALVAMQPDDALALAGKGFLDATRIAGGDGGLWSDIFQDNRDNLRQSIRALQEELARLDSMLEGGANPEQLKTWLTAAAERREALLQRKLRDMNPD